MDAALKFIYEAALKCGASRTQLKEHMRYIYNILDYLTDSYPETTAINIEIVRMLGDVRVRLNYKGDKLDTQQLIAHSMEIGPEPEEKLLDLLSNYYSSSSISNTYSNSKTNTTTFLLKKSSYRTLLRLLIALIGGTVTGLLIREFVPEAAGTFMAEHIFSSITSIFVNCVKMLVGPLIFFTIASSISSRSDLSVLGRIGKKLVILYFIDALIAMAVSTLVILLLKPGFNDTIPSIESFLANSADITATAQKVSVKDTLLNFFPSNFFKAFTDAAMMQIIFIALLFGVSVCLLTRQAKESLQRFLNYGNMLFCKMVSIVLILLPISVFCAMANTMIILGVDTLVLLADWVLALLAAFTVMILIYILFIAVFAKVSPAAFLSRYGEAITGTFAMGSCNSSMPNCATMMERKMGVTNGVSQITIPIGVSIHCASNCVFYLISAFFLANIFTGLDMTPLAKPMIFFTVFMLGIGAPSISGAGPICVAMILPQLGVPMGLITLIIGLDPFISMFKSACSCIEDAAVTLVIARSENSLNSPNTSGAEKKA